MIAENQQGCKNIKNVYAVSFQTPKAYLGGCNHHRHPEPSPATPEELSSTAPPFFTADDPSTEMLPPQWLKLFHTKIAPAAQRQNYNLIPGMPLRPHSGDPSFQDWRCWRKLEHTTCDMGRVTSPQFYNHRKLISGF